MKSEEERLKEIIAEGKDADSWLNHPKFKHVITIRKAALMSAFEKTGWKDEGERTEIWRKFQALNSIVTDFERLIRDARNAETKLAELIKRKFKVAK